MIMFIVLSVASILIVSAVLAAMYLPWLLVKGGYVEQVQVACFCASIVGLAALYCLSSNYGGEYSLVLLSSSVAGIALLYAINCALSLILKSKSIAH
jgi:hypothetical protein